MITVYTIFGNAREPMQAALPDDYFEQHDRANSWRSCFPTYREVRDFADMTRKVEAVLKEIFTQKKCNTQTNNG